MTAFIILFFFFFKAGCIHRRDKVALATEFVLFFLSVITPVATQYIGSIKTQPVVQCVCVNTLAQCGYAEVD